ncbi:hypothetical protein F5B17DRAFT_156712 [Nemania serpens]|nr:hypothetical protein F5B17DRAFT_156712 [Nemania serpens]
MSSPPDNIHTPDSDQTEASPSVTPVSSLEDHGFDLPPPDFDPNQTLAEFLAGRRQGLLNPADAVEEFIEDEIARQIAETEKVGKKPLTDGEKERIEKTIRHIGEGGWLESLKPQLIGKDAVPMEYFNRLVAEHEGTISKVAQINAMADRKVTKRDALIASLSEELRVEQAISRKSMNLYDALHNCDRRVNELQKQLESANQSLEESRRTASKYHDEVQALEQQKTDTTQRERANEEEIKRLRDKNKNLVDILKGNEKETDDLRSQITKLEAGAVKCSADVKCLEDKNRTLEDENKRLKDAGASQGEPTDLEDLRRQISELKAQLVERDNTITPLETRLAQASNTSASTQDRATCHDSNEELQARCKELRESRDWYKERWGRKITERNVALKQFWDAVENTQKEINQLYYGIEKLSRALGLADGVLDTPGVLDKVVTQVTASVNDVLSTPQLTIVNLRTANSLAQVQMETLRRQLDKAKRGRSEEEIRARLRVVDEEEMERRISLRTHAYRQQRETLFTHIFEAQVEFLALAERSFDRDAIEALVDRFLEPTLLPMIQLPTGQASP